MPSFKKRYDAKKKKDAIAALRNIIKLLESGEYVVETCDVWPGMEGKQNLKVSIKEADIFRPL